LILKEKYGWIGKVRLIKKDIKTNKILTDKVFFNRLMNNALDEIIKALYNTGETNMRLRHVGFGNDNTANNDTMESLENELYRVPIITGLRIGTGIVQSTGIMLDTEPPDLAGAITIKEIGFFAGENSLNWNDGGGKDTGLMISRLVISSESKTDTQQINIVREDQFSRG
jgi:hypothetical protein